MQFSTLTLYRLLAGNMYACNTCSYDSVIKCSELPVHTNLNTTQLLLTISSSVQPNTISLFLRL